METVHDIFAEALALERQGLSPRQVEDQVIDMGHDNGFAVINDCGSGRGGATYHVELTFPNGEIYLDGSDWYHRSGS